MSRQCLNNRRENIAPDYPLTLLEGLTTITHHCLLNHKVMRAHIQHTGTFNPTFLDSIEIEWIFFLSSPSCSHTPCQSLVACDSADVRNVRNAVIEELPHILNSMALLWGVIRREESQRRGSDSPQTIKQASVYFRSAKV